MPISRSMLTAAIFLNGTLALAIVAPPAPPKASVTVRELKKVQASEEHAYPARVVSETQAAILSEVDGVVTRLPINPGAPVKKGQVLLQVQNLDPLYRYAPYKVLAPATGVLSSLEVTEGTQVSRGQKLASITDPRRLKVTIEIPASEARHYSLGMKAEFRGLDTTAAPQTMVLKALSPWADPMTATSSAELKLEKPAAVDSLTPGSFGQAVFKTQSKAALLVPEHALFYRLEKTFVRVVESGKVKQVEVKLGRRVRGELEVESGLQEGQVLIERSSRFLKDGEEVEVSKSPS